MSTDDQNANPPAPAAPVDPWHAPGITANVKAAQDAVAALPTPAPKLFAPPAPAQTAPQSDAFTNAVARITSLESGAQVQTQQIADLGTALGACVAKLDASAQAGADTVAQISALITDLATRVRDLEMANASPSDGAH